MSPTVPTAAPWAEQQVSVKWAMDSILTEAKFAVNQPGGLIAMPYAKWERILRMAEMVQRMPLGS